MPTFGSTPAVLHWVLAARNYLIVLLIGLLLALSSEVRAEAVPEALAGWIRAEQKLSGREINTNRLTALSNQQEPQYAPSAGRVFDVKTYWLELKDVHTFLGEGLDHSLQEMFTRTIEGTKQVRLLVHPESEKFYSSVTKDAERGANLKATATASSRDLLVWPEGRGDEACFVKLSLDREVGGVIRTVPKSEVAQSIAINNTLRANHDVLPESFQFLPEVIGLVPIGMERGGMIVRAIPKKIRNGHTTVVPLFSLLTSETEGKAPLLAEMISTGSMDPQRYVVEKITRPLVQQIVRLGIKNGIVMEPRAQDLLIELGSDGQPSGRFYHRNLGRFQVSFSHRLNMKRPRHTPTVATKMEDYQDNDDSLAAALEVYEGFAFAAEKSLQKWQKEAVVGGKKVGNDSFKADLIREVQSAYKTMTGTKLDLKGDLETLREVVAHQRKTTR